MRHAVFTVHSVQLQVSVYCSAIPLSGAVKWSMLLFKGTKYYRTPDRGEIITGRTKQKVHRETFFIKEHVDSRLGFEFHSAVSTQGEQTPTKAKFAGSELSPET